MPSNGILLGAKFALRRSLAFSYINSVTARHSSSGRQPNFAAWYKEWNYGTFTDGATWQGGHHVGHQPTFLVLQYIYLRNTNSRRGFLADLGSLYEYNTLHYLTTRFRNSRIIVECKTDR